MTPMISQVQTSLSGVELLDTATKNSLTNMYSTHSSTSVDVNALIGAHVAELSSIDFTTMISVGIHILYYSSLKSSACSCRIIKHELSVFIHNSHCMHWGYKYSDVIDRH